MASKRDKDKPQGSQQQAPAEPEAAVGAVPCEQAQVDELRREIERLEQENLRLIAELRNVTQRAQREKSEALRYAEEKLAKELLPVVDDLERIISAGGDSKDVETVIEAVRIAHQHFLKVLRHCGIEPIEAAGRPFDPDCHEAMMQQPSADHPADTVMQEVQRGYKMHDRVIRPARVIVSSGAPDAGGQTSDEDAD